MKQLTHPPARSLVEPGLFRVRSFAIANVGPVGVVAAACGVALGRVRARDIAPTSATTSSTTERTAAP